MKVMNIVLDGYHPDNYCKLVYEDKYLPMDQYKLETLTTYTDGKNRLVSQRMWCRYYSRHYPTKTLDTKYAKYTTLYKLIPSESLLWNRLGKVGYPNFTYQSVFGDMTNEWLVPDQSITNTTLISKPWDGTLHTKFKSGQGFISKETQRNSTITHETDDVIFPQRYYDEMAKLHEKGNYDYDNDYIITAVEDAYFDIVNKELKENTQYFDDELFTELAKFVEDHPDEWFISLGEAATDTMYHFYVTPKYLKINREYVDHFIRKALEIAKPDVLIISGDHDMKSRNNLKKTLNIGEGLVVPVGKAYNRKLPLYTNHGDNVGGVILYNEKGKEFRDKLVSKLNPNKVKDTDDLFPEYLYDTILETFSKE